MNISKRIAAVGGMNGAQEVFIWRRTVSALEAENRDRPSVCDHLLRTQGDLQLWNPKDVEGRTVWFSWCAHCGALKVDYPWKSAKDHEWLIPKRSSGLRQTIGG